jgi:hypothetical protein
MLKFIAPFQLIIRPRCFPHIVNLACKAVLAAITNLTYAAEEAEDFVPPEEDDESEEDQYDEDMWYGENNPFMKAVRRRDPVATLRSLIRVVSFPPNLPI